VVGDDALIARIVSTDGDAIEFDRLIATPEFARPLARAGRLLGPRGLMPSAKVRFTVGCVCVCVCV
jgi:large subunit ribosomal protein L1